MKICEYCGKEHDGSYGSGRFCCAKCARKFSNRFVDEDGRKRQIQALLDPENREKGVLSARKKNLGKIKANKHPCANNIVNGSKITSLNLGKIGELKTIEKFLEKNIPVYTPIVDNSGVDLIADINGKLLKIQVKTSTRNDSEKTCFELTTTNARYKKNGERTGITKKYSSENIDYFSLYDYTSDELYMLKNTGEKSSVTIRLQPPKNNQYTNTNLKEDYNIDKIIDLICKDIDPDNVIESENFEIIDEENE